MLKNILIKLVNQFHGPQEALKHIRESLLASEQHPNVKKYFRQTSNQFARLDDLQGLPETHSW